MRTVGVLTKLDLMDSGTHALDILQGRGGYPLKLGFIGVVNRSQRDIDDGKSLKDAVADEQDFFNTHPVYKSISYKSGTSHLARTLNSVRHPSNINIFSRISLLSLLICFSGITEPHPGPIARYESTIEYPHRANATRTTRIWRSYVYG